MPDLPELAEEYRRYAVSLRTIGGPRREKAEALAAEYEALAAEAEAEARKKDPGAVAASGLMTRPSSVRCIIDAMLFVCHDRPQSEPNPLAKIVAAKRRG